MDAVGAFCLAGVGFATMFIVLPVAVLMLIFGVGRNVVGQIRKPTAKKRPAFESFDAGIRDLIAEGRIEEASEIYSKFTGIDKYQAWNAVLSIANEMQSINKM